MTRNLGKLALLAAALGLCACGNAQGDGELLSQTQQFAIEISQTWNTPKDSAASAVAALKKRSLSISSIAVSDGCKSIRDEIASSAASLAEFFEDAMEGNCTSCSVPIFAKQHRLADAMEAPAATTCQEGFKAVASDLRSSAKL